MDEFRQGAKLTNAVHSLVFESPIPLILCASWCLHVIFNMKKPKKCHFWTHTAIPEQQGDCTWEAASNVSNIAEYCVLSCDQSPQKQASMAEMEVSLHWMKWKAEREKRKSISSRVILNTFYRECKQFQASVVILLWKRSTKSALLLPECLHACFSMLFPGVEKKGRAPLFRNCVQRPVNSWAPFPLRQPVAKRVKWHNNEIQF